MYGIIGRLYFVEAKKISLNKVRCAQQRALFFFVNFIKSTNNSFLTLVH